MRQLSQVSDSKIQVLESAKRVRISGRNPQVLARTAKFHRTSHLRPLQRKQRHLFKSSSDPTPTAKMGRMHSNGKGISSSALPYSRTAPAWLKTTPDAVVDQICKLAKKGATPSQIGVVLRDSHGIAQVKIVTGMSSMTGLSRRIG
jgi:small subunit ribosomal protein S13e